MIQHSYKYLSLNFLSILISFISLPILTKFVGPYGYGVIALLTIFGGVLTKILSLSLSSASYRSFYKNGISKKFLIVNSTNIIYLIFIFLISFIVLFLYFDDLVLTKPFIKYQIDKQHILFVYGSSCLLIFYNLFSKFLVQQNMSSKYFFVDFSYKTLIALFSIILAFYLKNYWAIIYGTFFSTLLVVIYLFYINKKNILFKFSFKELKESIKFTIPLTINEIQGLFKNAFDRIYLLNFKGFYEVGYLEVANKFGNLNKLIYNSLNFSYTPFFMNLAKEESEDSLNKISTRYFEIIIFFNIVALIISFFSMEITVLLTDQSFHHIVFYIPLIISIGFLGECFSLAFKPVIFYKKKMNYMVPVTSLSLTSNILFNIILIPKYGIWGILISLLISEFLTSILMFFYICKINMFKINLKKFFLQFFLYIVFLLACYQILNLDLTYFYKFIIKCSLLSVYMVLMSKLIGFEQTRYYFKISLERVKKFLK